MNLRPHLSFANVMSCVAVFLVLGGGAFAATELAKLKKNSVTTKQVKDGSLLGQDFKSGELPAGERGPAGATGPAGPTGPTGADGQTGADGSARAYASVVYGSPPTLTAARTKNITAVSSPQAGLYCLTLAAGISAGSVAPQATVNWQQTNAPEGDAVAQFSSEGTAGGCGANDIPIRTERAAGAAAADAAANVSFTVMVP